jgi:pimeloyl-ACP methyl ester carboxylesterase
MPRNTRRRPGSPTSKRCAEALGYARWNLWGGSYGTRVAQEYLRRFPERVRTMTLDGVAPPGMVITLDVWRTREAVLAAIFGACEALPACRQAHPDVAATLTQIGTTLGAAGRDVDIVDPRTGEARREHVTLDVVLSALQPLTYAPELATLLPEMLTLATRGDFGPLLAANPLLSTNIPEQINTALHFSVTCAEDAPRITPAMEERALAGLLTQHLARQLIAVCEVWPRGTVAAGFTEPVRSDKPVLLISGGMDPVTPPAYGTEGREGPFQQQAHRRAGLWPHRHAAGVRAAAHRRVRRQRRVRQAAGDLCHPFRAKRAAAAVVEPAHPLKERCA